MNAAAGWLKDGDVHDHVHSILEIMQTALARQSMDTWMENAGAFKMAAYTIDRDSVADLHDRAFKVVVDCVSSDRPRIALRAASRSPARRPAAYLEVEDDELVRDA